MQKPTKEGSDPKIRAVKKEEVKYSEWQLFTCEGIFEPPMISSQTPIGSDKKAQFQSSVSFPGLTPPDQDRKETAIAKTMVSYVKHLFSNQATEPEQLLEQFWDISSQMASEEERDFLQRWLTLREDKIRQVASTSSTFIVDLLIDLTQFYNETESLDAQKS